MKMKLTSLIARLLQAFAVFIVATDSVKVWVGSPAIPQQLEKSNKKAG
ncbi:hypothetical protein [Paenibacillus gansuensis]|uniref:Cyclic lactone autoinducer peptide n=1 Tax=Paenibacillus gansuensis TaxID=306542 RepID=A0ABW5PHI0_9BACL